MCLLMSAVMFVFLIYILDSVFGVHLIAIGSGEKAESDQAVFTTANAANNLKGTNTDSDNLIITPSSQAGSSSPLEEPISNQKLNCKPSYFQNGSICDRCSLFLPRCL